MTDTIHFQDPYLRKLIKTRKQTVLIPVGSIEQHGPHLPVSTDSDIVSEIAQRISKKREFLILPTINYGVSFEHYPFFNLSLKKATLHKVLMDLCISLWKNKIRTIVILNGHHGNQSALYNIPKKIHNLSKGKIKVFVFSYWHFMKRDFDHAGFVETSLMLAISKKVKMKKAVKGFTPDRLSTKQKLRVNKLAAKSFISVTRNGIWGDPRNATAKEGNKILSEIVQTFLKESNLPY
ncbi:MAG TPA: creatininase family protein [Nitrosopumilaceae archaeon]|nr:creatininase family protein [Nitrosopumilaceae archaeon]